MPSPGSIPTHPEAVDGDPRTLRWIFPAGTLDFVGVPSRIPPPLQSLVDDGVVESVTVDPDALRITLAPELSWHDHGERTRSAIQSALQCPSDWQAPSGAGTDDILTRVVQQVIDGTVGDYIRSHGGQVELLAVHDADVEIQLGGACSHCPASSVTLTSRVEAAIRASYPGLGHLVARDLSGAVHAGRLFRRA